ncbi:coiled-coil domain-containing protein [Rothia uropygioeca]|uniref:hypothetical protein n=1 Tax=Kocuria sp. 257 TaxID=2021970 RepID=UPI0010137536|nr:hypothetical protein [Kocuria sp. 257]
MTARTRIHDDPIELWRSVAQLSPRVLPRPRASERASTVKDYLSGHHLPWEPAAGHVSHGKDRTWRHVVFAGLVQYRRLMTFTGLVSDDAAHTAELTALFAARVTEDGRLLAESLELSRAAWAAAVLGRQADVPTLFADAAEQWRAGAVDVLRERRVQMYGVRYHRITDDIERDHPLDRADITQIIKYTRNWLGLQALFPDKPKNLPIRIASTLVPPVNSVGDTSILNHPAAEDLDLATDTTRFRQAAAGLLGVDAAESFEDVTESREILYYALAPQMIPEGTFHLDRPTAATQFAINAALNELSHAEGLWCCPRRTAAGAPDPTWNDDMLAGLVTRRAVAMANIPDPAELFDPEPLTWSGSRQIFVPHPDLAQFEILRSSPLLDHADGTDTGSYSGVQGCQRARTDHLVFAPGVSPAQVRLLPGMEDGEPYREFTKDQNVEAVDAIDSVLNTLGHLSPHMTPEDYELWDETAEAVLASVERVHTLLRERQRFHEVVPMLLRNEEVVTDIAEALAESSGGIAEKEEELARLTQLHDAARACSMEFSDAIATHLRDEPRMISRLATFGRVRVPWRERLSQLRRSQSIAQAEEQDAQAKVDGVHRELRQLRAAHEALRDDLRENKASVRSLRDELASYRYPDQAIDQEWLAGDWQETGALAPWLDSEIQQARYEAFRAALRMHSMAIQGLPTEFRAGLLAARDLLSGHPSGDSTAVYAAWQVLCLVFPEVSIQAEFLPGICRSLGDHRLGWIVYSDSARLRPGVAYAGMLHAQRAILFADKSDDAAGAHQIAGSGIASTTVEHSSSPYMVPPDTAQIALAKANACSVDWAPSRTNAYELALAASRYSG